MAEKPDKHYKPWSAAEIALLRRCASEGLGYAETAERIGRTPKATHNRAKRLGIKCKRRVPVIATFWTPERVARLRELWGVQRVRAIARELGCTGNAVIGKADRLGLPRIVPDKFYLDATAARAP